MSEMSDGTDFSDSPSSAVTHLRTCACGFCMGAADIVPGVSGGTVALILGVYERLVFAISQCNVEFVKLLLGREWSRAAHHIDLKFVAALACGIAAGIGGLASLMNHLLSNHMSMTFATFTGMILASSLLVARRIPDWKMEYFGLLLVGALFALRLVTLPGLQNPPESLWYMFFCGTVGITAMILPGISGAFILLLLSRYHFITGSIKEVLRGNLTAEVFLSLSVFAVGCLVGLLSFSRVLQWLLRHHHNGTMAVLCGFMLGSLYKLWPFQRETSLNVLKFKDRKFEHFLPDGLGRNVWLAIVLCAVGIAVVLLLDAISARQSASAGTAANAD